jgi:cyclopropane fatty-acyl-phospholipid synthase-like methyltransferase
VGCAGIEQSPAVKGLDAPYVPTADVAVAEMLREAKVGPNDVVYDLGSGDGRIVIAAARDFGARGVGIELDPKLVQQSREAALAAGVAERTQFIWKDIFEADLSPATVVTVYLFPEVNARLLPKFRRELRPGARVVSHQYAIGDWKPDRSILMKGPSRSHTLLFWTVPATW